MHYCAEPADGDRAHSRSFGLLSAGDHGLTDPAQINVAERVVAHPEPADRPRLYLLSLVDVLRSPADVCGFLEALRVCALASPGTDRHHDLQGLHLRRMATRARLDRKSVV